MVGQALTEALFLENCIVVPTSSNIRKCIQAYQSEGPGSVVQSVRSGIVVLEIRVLISPESVSSNDPCFIQVQADDEHCWPTRR